MKRIRLVQIINVTLFVLYIGLFITDLIIEFLLDKRNIYFSIVLALVSGSMLYKGVLLKSGSALWCSLNLILYAISIVIMEIFHINYTEYYYFFALLPIIPSLINLAIFSKLIYIKVIILNISIFVPIILSQLFKINWWQKLLIAIISVILGILICRFIKFKKETI